MAAGKKTLLEWQQEILSLKAERDRFQAERDAAVSEALEAQRELRDLKEQLAALQRRHFGRRSEKLNPNQLLLFAERGTEETPSPADSRTVDVAADEESAEIPAKTKRKSPKDRPRFTVPVETKVIEYPVENLDCSACGSLMEEIGEERSTQIEYKPARFVELIHVRKKVACKECQDCVRRAPPPNRVLAKALPGTLLASWILVSKYQDHLPLNRLARIFRRQGAILSRSTLCDWVMGLADRLRGIVEVMKQEILASSYLQTDDTRVMTFVSKGNSKRKLVQAYLWPYRTIDQVVFDFTLSRSRDGPEEFLQNFNGFLQTDDYVGYHRLQNRPEIVGVGCMAHARRRFHEVLEQKNDLQRVLPIIACMRLLYEIEQEIRDQKLSEEEVRALRQQRSRPVLADLLRFLRMYDKDPAVTPKSQLGKAVSYMLRNWKNLCRYTKHGQLRIDNNLVEQCVRPIALGRKNWLFAGSPRGGQAAATIYSIIESCRLLDVDPFLYLQDVFRQFTDNNQDLDLALLTPKHWKATRAFEVEKQQSTVYRDQLPAD